MKAFGVRLAAGAVTILFGAMMAAQAQKDQESTTDSAWTEENLPAPQPVEPIGAMAELTAADPSELPEFSSPDTSDLGSGSGSDQAGDLNPSLDSGDAIQLVQHTMPIDDAASMTLPEIGAPAENPSTGSAASMKMGLPSFDEIPPTQDEVATPEMTNAAAGPAMGMGLPSAPVMSDVRFADSETANSPSQPAADLPPSDQTLAGDFPVNDLRGGSGNNLRGEPNQPIDYNATASELPGSTGPAMSVPGFDSGSESQSYREPPAMLQSGQDSGQNHGREFGEQPNDDPTMPADAGTMMGFASSPTLVGGQPPFAETPSAPAANTMPPSMGNAQQSYPSQQGMPASNYASPQTPELPPSNLPADEQYGQASTPAMPGYGTGGGMPNMVNPNGSRGRVAFENAGYKQNPTAPQAQSPYGGPAISNDPRPAGTAMASPGDRVLDGPQAPSVVIHKRAPAEVKVGKTSTFTLVVRNVGSAKALDVLVRDQVPTGMRLEDATPSPNPQSSQELLWQLGDMEPGQEQTITLQMTPMQEGELGSVARVSFQAAASVRTISTRPALKIVQKAPERVLIGQQLEIELEVSNPGTGVATGVVLQEDVPSGLQHPQGKQLDNLIGTIGPGEIRKQILRMKAVQPGVVQNQIRVKGEDGLESTHTVAVEVVAPELQLTMSGPSRRFLERQATYQIHVENVGTYKAENMELSLQLDRGFTFVKTERQGQYDPSRHAVFWSLSQLPAGEKGFVNVTLLPVEEGERVLRTQASADLGVKSDAEAKVAVQSLAELSFSINDSADPIEVGGETTYEIRIRNSGSRDDTNVNVAMQLPNGLQLVEQGDFTPRGDGVIQFSPRALLKANDEMVYQVKVRGAAPATHLIKAIVTSDQSKVAVTKEESTVVYSDQ